MRHHSITRHNADGTFTKYYNTLEHQWDNFIRDESWAIHCRFIECCTFSTQRSVNSLLSKDTLGL